MAKPGEHKIVPCKQCGTEYRQSRSDQKWCSSKCASTAWRDRNYDYKMLNCKVCGEEFTRMRSRQACCSRECGAELQSRKKSEKYAKEIGNGKGKGWAKGMEFAERSVCQVCGTKFACPPVQKRRGGGKFCSVKCRARTQQGKPPPVGKSGWGKTGKRPDLDNRFFRSRWEANYARYLNWLVKHEEIEKWEYEVDTFEFPVKRGTRFYTPDFKVWEKDGSFEYHEVKGYMDKVSATKLKRMKKYYPQHKVVLIEKDVYMDLKKKMSRILEGWEFGLAKEGKYRA